MGPALKSENKFLNQLFSTKLQYKIIVKMYLFRAFFRPGIFMQTNLLQAYLKEAEI